MKKFTKLENDVMFNKATEAPFSGIYDDHYLEGVYVCKNCGNLLYYSKDKFKSHCGWPAFDDEGFEAIRRQTDADGRRIEILCNNCGIHLGHVFEGEALTQKNLRHCVNSVSLNFIPADRLKEIVVGCGCFWGVQYWFNKLEGVISTMSGYSGGQTENPSYKEVCQKETGHYEVLKIIYDSNAIDLKKVLQYFFEIHDFEQKDGQGADVGKQYESVIFFDNSDQKQLAEDIIKSLNSKGYKVATKLLEAKPFYPAEKYHQNYYKKNGQSPYCHFYKKIF